MTDTPSTAPAPPPIALVTGASRGLGAAMAQDLAGRGWQVIAVARTVGALEELDDRIRAAGGRNPTLVPLDLSQPETVARFGADLGARWPGGLGLWAHCAIHAAPLTPADHIDPRDWAKSLDLNVTATAQLIGLIAPALIQGRGQALFVDDPRAGQPFFGSYGATKAAQIALARSWQAETTRTAPRVDIVAAQPMPTATRARFFPGEDRAALTPCADEAARILDAHLSDTQA